MLLYYSFSFNTQRPILFSILKNENILNKCNGWIKLEYRLSKSSDIDTKHKITIQWLYIKVKIILQNDSNPILLRLSSSPLYNFHSQSLLKVCLGLIHPCDLPLDQTAEETFQSVSQERESQRERELDQEITLMMMLQSSIPQLPSLVMLLATAMLQLCFAKLLQFSFHPIPLQSMKTFQTFNWPIKPQPFPDFPPYSPSLGLY